ncbi:hypothetical protein T09_13743 [Trichinella sp. T9]|nr:hypothetical protein T09_13743 [Trichinella sp. T9]
MYDALESDYGAVVYMHTEATNRSTVENSVREKTRVTPIRRVTLPREKSTHYRGWSSWGPSWWQNCPEYFGSGRAFHHLLVQ